MDTSYETQVDTADKPSRHRVPGGCVVDGRSGGVARRLSGIGSPGAQCDPGFRVSRRRGRSQLDRGGAISQRFNDADITARITALTHAQRIVFYPSAPQRIVDIIATVDLDAAFHGALSSLNWSRVAVHLNQSTDPDLASRIRLMSAGEKASTLAACPAEFTRVRIALIGMPTNPTGFIPFDHNPRSSPGEHIIFDSTYQHVDPTQFKMVYSCTGGTFDAAGGPVTKTINGLVSGNVLFIIDPAWTGAASTTGRLEIRFIDDTLATSESWTFAKKTVTPTTMVQLETEGDRPLGSIYHYQLGPDIGTPGGGPDYQYRTVLERFDAMTCNIRVADLKPAYAATNGLTDDAAVCRHFFGDSGSNGTFSIDANDRVADLHGGGIPSWPRSAVPRKR